MFDWIFFSFSPHSIARNAVSVFLLFGVFLFFLQDGIHSSTADVRLSVEEKVVVPAPVFSGATTGLVSEADEIGSLVLTVRASTGSKTSDRIVYRLLDEADADGFELDAVSGELRTARTFDRESLDAGGYLTVTVRAAALDTITGEEMKSTDAVFRVVVLDSNDEAPKFGQPEYSAVIQENMPSGTPLGGLNIVVNDADSVGPSSPFVFKTRRLFLFFVLGHERRFRPRTRRRVLHVQRRTEIGRGVCQRGHPIGRRTSRLRESQPSKIHPPGNDDHRMLLLLLLFVGSFVVLFFLLDERSSADDRAMTSVGHVETIHGSRPSHTEKRTATDLRLTFRVKSGGNCDLESVLVMQQPQRGGKHGRDSCRGGFLQSLKVAAVLEEGGSST